MTIQETIKIRHSVRSYQAKAVPQEIIDQIQAEIDTCNKESGLHIQLIINEPKTFDGFMAHYGKFYGVQNYIALIGTKTADLEEKAGYYGEYVALLAQSLGLNTCWVAMTFSKGVTKKHCSIRSGEKLVAVLSLGYGENQGTARKSKSISELSNYTDGMPQWFVDGIESAMLAPTAMNQQKFLLTLNVASVEAKSLGGFYSKVDLGIVKYHFEIGAGKENFRWK